MLNSEFFRIEVIANFLIIGVFCAIWLMTIRLFPVFDFYKITLMAIFAIIIFGSFATWMLGSGGEKISLSYMLTLRGITYGSIIADMVYGILLSCVIYPFLKQDVEKTDDFDHLSLNESLFDQARRLQNFQWWLVGAMIIAAAFFEYILPWLLRFS